MPFSVAAVKASEEGEGKGCLNLGERAAAWASALC